MKKLMCILLSIILVLPAACSSKNPTPGANTAAPSAASSKRSSKADVDLTSMSSNMVYAEVYAMVTEPNDYIGKTVRMRGEFSVYHDESQDKYYYACMISDATACCAQGIEFEPAAALSYPADFPSEGTVITVLGTFSTYTESGGEYITLSNAVIE